MDHHRRLAREQEKIDRAIAVSLVEDLNRPIDRLIKKGGWFEDSFFSSEPRGLGTMPSFSHFPPSYPRNNPVPRYSTENRICGGCKRSIGYGNYLGCMGTYYHPACFRCRACGYQITEQEYSLSGKDAYHKSCFRQQTTYPKCEVCHQYIPKNAAGLIEYRCHPFWSQKYCPAHESDNTTRCCSCERLKPRSAEYVALGDGRSLCLECLETAIMDTGECQPLYHAIRDYYEGMNMRLDQQIPMLLVERQALNEAVVGEKHGLHNMAETRGLCLSEEQTIPSINKRLTFGGQRFVGMRTQPLKLTRTCDVTAILVLYGLPRLLTGSILAHELMHAWMRLNGFPDLRPEVEEGISQVMAYMWLETEVMPEVGSMPRASSSSSSSSSSKKCQKPEVEKRLGKFFMEQIAKDTSVYGAGFRAAYAAVNKHGLRSTLNHIRYTGTFPL